MEPGPLEALAPSPGVVPRPRRSVLVSTGTEPAANGSAMKILVVDDHPLILEALRLVLQRLEATVEVVEAPSAEAGRRLAAEHPDLDLLLLDLTLPGVNGLELLEELRQDYPAVPVVVLSASERPEDVVRALDLGAMGYIPKTSSNEVMLQALRLVFSGGIYVPRAAIAQQAQLTPVSATRTSAPGSVLAPHELGLTERQIEVLALILQGLPNKLICRQLNLSEGTVKIHVAAILRALNVHNRTQAVIEASRLGLTIDGLLMGRGPEEPPATDTAS